MLVGVYQRKLKRLWVRWRRRSGMGGTAFLLCYTAREEANPMPPITLEVSDELAQRLRPLADRLPRILELGLRELNAAAQPGFVGASRVLELLAGLPAPEELLALRPSDALQARVSALLEKNRAEGLTAEEEQEWEQYQYLEHLVRMAKAKALLKLKTA